MRAVNLLPRQASSKRNGVDRTLVAAVVLTVLVTVAVLGGFFLEKAQAATERQRLAAAQAALALAQSQQPTTHSPAPAQLQIPAVLSQQQPWQTALASAFSSRVAWDTLLTQLEYAVPNTVTLTNVTLGGAGAAPGLPGTMITIGGNTFSTADVATFMSTLARVPKLSQVTLVSSTSTTGSKIVVFQITAQMTLPVVPTAPTSGTTTTATTGSAG